MKVIKSIRKIIHQTTLIPFETMFAIYSFYAGIAGLLDFGITSRIFYQVVGTTIAAIFDMAYVLAGFSMFLGIGLNKKNLESFGIITVATSAAIRTIAVGFFAGIDPTVINSYFFSFIFTSACYLRLKVLIHAAKIETAINNEVKRNG